MKAKKIILILLLIFSIVSLVIIVYFAKNRVGLFGKFYDNDVRTSTEKVGKVIKNNMDQVFFEIKTLAQDGLVKSIFISSTLGEDTDKYLSDFTKVKDGIAGCDKIQTIDTDGKIIFSTLTDEINLQRVKPAIIEKLKSYFTANQNVFLYFLDKSQFVTIYPMASVQSNGVFQGFIALYYKNSRLLTGISKNKHIPFSFDNFVFLSSSKVDGNDINKILNYYTTSESVKKPLIDPTIGGVASFNGIKVINYTKNEPYISIWTIIFLLIDLLLLALVVLTLIQVIREDKLYREIPLRSLKEDEETPFQYKDRGNLKDLVDDIEDNTRYDEAAANRGIEEMILSNDIDLTEVAEDKSPFKAEPEFDTDLPSLDTKQGLEDAVPSVEEHDIVAIDDKPIELNMDDIESFDSIQPTKETELFAEEDRILSGMDSGPIKLKDDNAVSDDYLDETVPVAQEEVLSINPEQQMELNEALAPDNAPVEIEIPDFEASIEPVEHTIETIEPDFGTSAPTMEEPMPAFGGTEEIKFDEPLQIEETQVIDEPIGLVEEPVMVQEPEDISSFIEPIDMPLESPVERAVEPEPLPPIDIESPSVEDDAAGNFKRVMSEPPKRTSSISTVEDYGNVAMDLAQNSLNIHQVMILKKAGDQFTNVQHTGFDLPEFNLSTDDPIYSLFLCKGKSLDIKGNLKETRYLKERFPLETLEKLDELLIVPITKETEIVGIALYGREAGVPEPTNFQKSELYNMGFLQEI